MNYLVKKQYYAYVILCDNGTLYKGQTNNLFRRMGEHFSGNGSRWTHMHKPVRLIYYRVFDTRREALAQERKWKNGVHGLRKKMMKLGLM